MKRRARGSATAACRRTGVVLIRRVALSVVGVLFAACSAGTVIGPGDTTQFGGNSSNWLVVLYMSADNDLEAQAIEDLNELEAVDLSGTGITVLALVDRIAGYDASNGDWTGTRLYEIVHDPDGVDGQINSVPVAASALGIDVPGDEVELDLSDPNTLETLLDFAFHHYAPRRLALVIWGHGSGYRAAADGSRATSFDDTSGGEALFTAELAAAINGHPVDVIAFDTCFAASIEVAYELRHGAALMVGSQDLIPADGWEYDNLLTRFAASDQSPTEFGAAAVESYRASYPSFSSATISVIDLGSIDAVNLALNDLSDQLRDCVSDPASRNDLRERLFYDVEDFYTTPGDLAIDLRHMAELAGRNYAPAGPAAAALEAAVADAVLYQWSNSAGNPNAGGLSVHYVPLAADGSAQPSHDIAYFRGADPRSPLAFVADSTWVPTLPDGPGLLHRLFYEVLE
jgi:hypothetical protein